MNRGVPQGSILGPLLFLIYINDIKKSIVHGSVKLFADDTTIFYKGTKMGDIQHLIEEDLTNIGNWLCFNKLAVNVSKSNYMVICSRQRYQSLPVQHLDIRLLGLPIVKTTKFKYLGVVLDETLSWKYHIETLCASLSHLINIFAKARYVVPRSIMKMLYFAMFHSRLQYCIESWGSADPSVLLPLIIMQKKIMRIIMFKGFTDHTADLFKTLEILSVSQEHSLRTLLIVYNELYCKGHSNYGFVKLNHPHSTRQRARGQLDLRSSSHGFEAKTNYAFRSILYKGSQLFNTLPQYIGNSKTKLSFKKRCKAWLLGLSSNCSSMH